MKQFIKPTIHVVAADEKYTPEIGSILWGADHYDNEMPIQVPIPPMCLAASQINKLDDYEKQHFGLPADLLTEEGHGDGQMIVLATVHNNPLTAIRILGIDNEWFEGASYVCPYTNYKFYGVVPNTLFTKDASKYIEPLSHVHGEHTIEMILDTDWWMRQHRPMERSKFENLLLGSGYTYGCSINDGNGRPQPAKIKLNNDDWLFVHFWEWYNK